MKSLIADDISILRRLIHNMLVSHGVCDFAQNGLEVIDKFKQFINTPDQYDLICLDIMMPQLDGIETLKRIRELEDENKVVKDKRVKIMILSSLNEEKYIKAAIENGCDGYLIKPYTKEKMNEELKKLGLI